MPTFEAGEKSSGPGWGCSCKSSKFGEPTPEQAIMTLARSANVTVALKKKFSNGKLEFEAWTDPESRYVVTYDPELPGTFCKHATACAIHFAPWQRQAALGAKGLLEKAATLERENRKLRKELEKWKKSTDSPSMVSSMAHFR